MVVKTVIKKIYFGVLHCIQNYFRNMRNKKLRKRLINKNPSIIGDNCNVGLMYHDLGIRFNSPTIDLYIYPDDYIKFLGKLKYYTSHEIIEVFEDGVNFPIGQIDDIKVYFMHYDSFEIAKSKWQERCKRIDYNNLFITMTKKSARCTDEHIKAFDKLPYKNKVIFTNRLYPEIKSSYYIRGFEKRDGVGVLLSYKCPSFLAKRYFEDFDYVSFINSGNKNAE